MIAQRLRSSILSEANTKFVTILQNVTPGTSFTFSNVDFGPYYAGRTILISSIVYSATNAGESTGLTIDGVATTHTLSAGNFVPGGASILAFSATRDFTGTTGTIVVSTAVTKSTCTIIVYTTPNQVALTPVSTNSSTGSSGTSVSFSNVATLNNDIILGMAGNLSTSPLTYTGGLSYTTDITNSSRIEGSAQFFAPASTRTLTFSWVGSAGYRVGYGIFR